MWLDADGETLYCLNNPLYQSDINYRQAEVRAHLFKIHLPSQRFTLLQAMDTWIVPALVQRSATEYYYLNDDAQGYFNRDSSPRYNHTAQAVIKKLVIDAQGTATVTTEAESVSVSNIVLTFGAFVKFIAWDGTSSTPEVGRYMSMTGDTYRVLCMLYFYGGTPRVQFNVYERTVTDAVGVWHLVHGNTWDAPAGSGGARGQDKTGETHRDPVTGQQVITPSGRGWFPVTDGARDEAPVHILDTDTFALWYQEPAASNIAVGIRCKEVGTAIPFSLHLNNDLTANGIVQGVPTRAVTINSRTFFTVGTQLYERQARTSALAASVNGGGGGYHCRTIGSSADIGAPHHFYVQSGATYAMNQTTGAIYRIETNGTVTPAHPAFPSLTYSLEKSAQWSGRYTPSSAAPVLYQNKPLVYANYTCPGNRRSSGYLKSLLQRTTETITYGILTPVINHEADIFTYLSQLVSNNFGYWYFDIERLVIRFRQRSGYTLSAYNASTGILRYTQAADTQETTIPSAGHIVVSGQILPYTGIGTETVGETTYPTFTGITRDISTYATKLLIGVPVYPVAAVLRDTGLAAEVLSVTYNTERVNTVEKLRLNVIGSDNEREPVQVNPGNKVTDIDILPSSELSPSELETLYQRHLAGESLLVNVTIVPDYSLTIGDTIYLVSQQTGFKSICTIVSITYALDKMSLKLKTVPTAPQQSWPLGFGHPTQRGCAYDTETDRLYISFTTNGQLRYFPTNIVTGEADIAAHVTVGVAGGSIRRAGNMAVHERWLYLKSARAPDGGLINRFNLDTFQSEAPWQYLPTGHTWSSGAARDELIVDDNGGVWLNTDTTARTLTKITPATGTVSPTNRATFSSETLTYPAGLLARRFTFWDGLFWGVDTSGDAPVLKGFRDADGTVTVERTVTLPSNIFDGNFSGFTRGRRGWYIVTRTDLNFVPD